MSTADHLVFAIIRFLDEQSKSVSEETAESLEVAKQCLETAYGITLEDAPKYPMPASLEEVFRHGLNHCPPAPSRQTTQVSPEDKTLAEKFKSEGNEFMKADKYEEALDQYTKAINKDGSNAVYYCNRAAAYSKLEKHQEALEDCEKALRIDPQYSKAFGRKGLAHSALNQHAEAVECYRKALLLDPGNASYQQNLDIASHKVSGSQTVSGGIGGGGMGGMDFTSLFSNPALMNMATQMMSNPEMQQMMAGLMSGAQQQQSGGEGFASLLQAGQRLAQQMQEANPDLVEQLRTQMNNPDQRPNPPN